MTLPTQSAWKLVKQSKGFQSGTAMSFCRADDHESVSFSEEVWIKVQATQGRKRETQGGRGNVARVTRVTTVHSWPELAARSNLNVRGSV